MTFKQLQEEVTEWAEANFGPPIPPYNRPLMGVGEELGELFHSQLKWEQGIRGSEEEHTAAAQDAVGDIVIFLSDYCRQRGWDFQSIMEETWSRVKQRNWKKNPVTGQA